MSNFEPELMAIEIPIFELGSAGNTDVFGYLI